MPRKLPLWLTDFPPGEPAHGVLLRIAELNGLSTTDALEMIGGEPTWIFATRTTNAILREVGEEFSDVVQQSTPRFEGRRYIHVNGERLSNKLHWVRRTIRRRCPRCLVDSPHHRVWWDATAITACPIHAVELEDKCLVAGCECKMGWTSGRITKCEYGHDLTVLCRAVPVSELSAEAYIAGRLGLPGYDPVPFLDGAYLDDAIELMDKVGRVAIGGNRITMPTLLSLGVSSRVARLKGFEILSLGEIGFENLLASIAQNNIDGSAGRSLTPRYGWLYQWLCHGPRSSLHNRLLALLAHHAKGHVPTKALDDPFTTIRRAANQLDISSSRLRRILTALGLVRADHRQGLFLGVQREHVETIGSMLHGSTSLEEAARRIGENTHVLTQLIKCGILPTAIRAGTKGHAAPILKIAEVDELIERLIDGVPLVTALPEGLMSLQRVGRATPMQYTEIIRLILAGKLKPAARLAGAPPISGLAFHYNEARAAYLSDTRTALTSNEAAREIGLNSKGFRALVKGNYIKGESRVESKRRFVAISRVELDRFKAKYATATEFAQILGTDASQAGRRLMQLGLQPAISRDKCRKLFFYREDIDALLSRLTTIPTSNEIRGSFWLGLHNECQRLKSPLRIHARHGRTTRIDFASGITNVRLAILFSYVTSKIRVGFIIKNGAQRALRIFLESQIETISRDVGTRFELMPRNKNQEPLILADCPHGKLFDQTTWPEIYNWVLEVFPKLLQAVKIRLEGFRYRREPVASIIAKRGLRAA
jgi:hypothetical protein